MTNEAPITTLGLALIVMFTTAISTSVPLWFQNRRKSKEAEEARIAKAQEAEEARKSKLEDWARLDEVARSAAEDRRAAAEVAKLLLAANERVAANSGQMNDKLDDLQEESTKILKFTDGAFTESLRGQHDEAVRGLLSLEEVMSLKKEKGQEPSAAALEVIKATKERIKELKERIEDRERQQERIDAKKR